MGKDVVEAEEVGMCETWTRWWDSVVQWNMQD